MYYLGVDLGGTNIFVGLVDENGKIISKESTPTISVRSADLILDDLIALCKKVVAENNLELSDVEYVGIGVPGVVNRETGVLEYANNLNFNHTNIAEYVGKALGLPVYLENDANCAAIGEITAGAGDGLKNVIYITLGTGVGSGIIVNGKLLRGAFGGGTEAGHMVVMYEGEQCTCGRLGYWEAYASATALAREGRMAAAKYPNCEIYNLVDGNIKLINAKMVFDAGDKGDEVALDIIDKYIKYVAIGIVNLVNIFEPQSVIIGGGVCAQGVKLTRPIQQIVRDKAYGGNCKTEIKVAKLGNDAGIVGAAMLGNYQE